MSIFRQWEALINQIETSHWGIDWKYFHNPSKNLFFICNNSKGQICDTLCDNL